MKQGNGLKMAKRIKVPLLDLKKEYLFLKRGIDKQIKDCLISQSWILGKKVGQFEKEIAKHLGAKYAIAVASGTDALLLALRALAIKIKNKEYFEKKDEIITTSFTFVATAEAIVRSGATPVFVDIDPATFNIDPAQIKKAISKNTVGILPVHLFGLACPMDKIMAIAKENNLFVVEDVAQSFGAEWRSEVREQMSDDRNKLGTIGDCGAFSFFPSKNLGSYGDAGLVATNDETLAKFINTLRNHGQTKQYDASFVGYNSRLDTIQAAILLAKLKYVDKFNALRIKIAQKYDAALRGVTWLQIPQYTRGQMPDFRGQKRECVYNLYTIKVNKNIRDKLISFLNTQGIQARVYYPLALHEMKAFSKAKVNGELKNTEEATQSVLSLPIHPFLKDNEVDYITDTIKSFTAILSFS
jgi:dTDP-4-amino-4,6-dideoxygalactose transaminase